MEMDLEIEVMGREVIKPATPSPPNHIQLSLLDMSIPSMYFSTIFFYKSEGLVTASPEIISKKLKSSLSETLSRLYPLAGEIEGVSINCNDKGAVFTEARTNLLLPEFLKTFSVDSLAQLRPKIEAGDDPSGWPLLSVGVTFFGSGSGVAVSVNASHRIFDAASLLTFVTDWSDTMANKNSKVGTHQFAEATIYPPAPTHMASQSRKTDTKKCAMNRFVFESPKIAELKRKAASESVKMPTRVEAITSLIWKCATNASRSKLMAPRPTLMYVAVDLRLKLPSSVLSPDAIGNLQTAFFLKKDAESEPEIHEAVAAFRTGKEEVDKMLKDSVQSNTLVQGLLNMMASQGAEFKPDVDIYTTSSWLGKPFYGVDFGWGSPVWLGSATHTVYDKMVYVSLIDSKDGEGVEAWISIPAEDMSVLVHDQELLAYAVLNPPITI
ncbi:HXXXD-type acyl-transferase family protein [Raphanus sativus]|uniref:BAHD acyltransferase BIA1-like n=1 Tax=Raphanus sativus TaxID=3726 RepID=A0A6J0N7Q7_RAPSA|nr:BAHD acyltransferase BIA1-like [Raphanus sativus]KAJ4902813.1 HXXXD-type acyl-transferase family protein [Raphanus sativus]